MKIPSINPPTGSSVSTTTASKSVAPRAEVSKAATEANVSKPLVTKDEFVRGGCFPGGGCFPIPVKPAADAKTRATQGNQLNEIADGVRGGSLTEKESEALLKEQEAIANYQQKAMADGKLSTEEQLRLGVMQARAELNIHKATHNNERDWFAGFDQNAQRQADQIDRVAEGRKNGNITNTEAGELIGDQADISRARQNTGGLLGDFMVDSKLDAADREIKRHSAPGTQWDLQPLPFPIPRPGPLPLPQPRPWPELPRPEFPRPEFPRPIPLFDKGVING